MAWPSSWGSLGSLGSAATGGGGGTSPMGSTDAMRGLGCSGPMPRPSSGTARSFSSRRVAGTAVRDAGTAVRDAHHQGCANAGADGGGGGGGGAGAYGGGYGGVGGGYGGVGGGYGGVGVGVGGGWQPGGQRGSGALLHPSSAGRRERRPSSFGRYTPVPEELDEKSSPQWSPERAGGSGSDGASHGGSHHSSPRKSTSGASGAASPTKAALANFGAL